ncbi:tRNA uridine 5-oxyacetic acid(34) methyltransferase CmoM [Salmonella enterica subsp. enterica serovar Uganda]|uniref:tRNA uridine 5-oxyacetic acid(34) methyltransferase CmoM n=1 Tax=Salmonella enterica TaxID=28901 RepID=UPI00238188D3|nr:tRNA uridine 5-oxyacetic acid(34) methyltransferase CmoM [Salmonella enterica]WDW78760.1 tRNA uridine 5-oxyacetic acid(34) methyltransferase CmoM [Salmonella enterica subsp. enterica serovar Uganda]
MQDRNFDDIAEKFSRNIYGTTKGQLRQAILWQDLDRVLEEIGGRKLRVLDAGGGEGQTAIKMAERGHQVTLCDLSGEMIARARQAAEAKGVSKDMHFIQCPAQDVASHLESPVDLILFHAVLEWVADPVGVLETLWSVLRPGGVLSLMFYNANGLLMHNMVAGNFDYVQAGVPKPTKSPPVPGYPPHPPLGSQGLQANCLSLLRKNRAPVLSVFSREKHQQRDCYETLVELETRYCRQEPYISLGRYIHVTAIKSPALAADARITYE